MIINNIKNRVLTSEEYVKPEIEIIEIDNEGSILAASGGLDGFGDGGSGGEIWS